MAVTISFNNRRAITQSELGASYYKVNSGTFTVISMTSGKLMSDTGVLAGDYLLWGITNQCNKPRGMRFHVGTAWTAVGLTGVWEYRKVDGSWASFAGVSDATNGFSTAGTNLDVTWTVPTDWGSNATSVNGISGRLWFRWRITALTSYTVAPSLGGTTPAATEIYDNAVRIDDNGDYDSGTATSAVAIDGTTLTDTGKAWATNILMNRIIYIHTGTGLGQRKRIKSNTGTVITIYDQWDVALDTTSQYVILQNFEDVYQADVSNGWGVVSKLGNHTYYFNCFLDIRAGAFGDINTHVEFNNEYFFYTNNINTARYPLIFGLRLRKMYGLDKGMWGNSFMTSRTSPVDNRGFGYYVTSSYVFSAYNRFIQRFDYPLSGSDGFIRTWFATNCKETIGDYWEGWRSVTFGNSSNEARDVTVTFGHSGVESPLASFNGVRSFYNASLGLFVTGATNYNLKDFEVNLQNPDGGSRFFSPVQFFSYTGTTTKYKNLKPRQRPNTDIFSTGSTGRSQPQVTIRSLITDEFGNPLPNATMRISDSLDRNKFNVVNFTTTTHNITAPNSATGNQFSGSTAFSVEAWIYTRSTGGGTFGRIVDKGNSGLGYLLFNNAGQYVFRVITGGTAYTSPGAGYANGCWNHVVGVWDGSTVQIYINGNAAGSAVATSGSASNDTAETFYIGNASSATRNHDGFIRRVRLFRNKALSGSDVTTLYNTGLFTMNEASPISGCTAEYNFIDETGTTLTDTFGNNGTIAGSPAWYSTNTGLTTQNYTLTTGSVGEFLSGQAVTTNNYYSLTSQPTLGTRLRVSITNFVDTTNSVGGHARLEISGTDNDGNIISEMLLVEEFGTGSYLTQQEFKTVDASGIFIVGFNGNITIDRAGLTYPQDVDIESWCAPNDINLLTANFNPITLKISAPGYEPVTIKKNMYEKQDLHIPLKKSVLDLT